MPPGYRHRRPAFAALALSACAVASAGEPVRYAIDPVHTRVMFEIDHAGFSRAIGTLSGGQTQRMLFARLLLQDARIVVLDEPFNAIDTRTAADLIHIVRRWHAEGRTIVAALHDLDLVRANFPQTLLLAREPVAWGETAITLTAENMLKARRMCEAFDEEAQACAA